MAPQPSVGSKVLAKGRAGEVVLHDPEDPTMTYKVSFEDGSTDWFKQIDVSLDAAEAAGPEDEEETKRKAQRAAEEMASLKEKQAKQKEDCEAQRQAAIKVLEEEKAKMAEPGYKEQQFVAAEPPTALPLSTAKAITEDNDVF